MKILDWNIQWCLGVDGRVDPKRIVDEARALADFDILCLQEVACNFPALKGSAGEDQFALIAALLPGFTAIPGIAVDTAAADGSRRTFGNMILSRLPVRQVDARAAALAERPRRGPACRGCCSRRWCRRRSACCG